MKYLLDTHILIWYFSGDKQLSDKNRSIIEDSQNEIYYSPLSIYEIEFKRAKHPGSLPFTGSEIINYCREYNFKFLPPLENHTLQAKNLKRHENTPPHNDPFDKMMLCQAVAENMQFMTHDSRIAEYDCPNILKI